MSFYVKSADIHIYPCANREKDIDLESKIMTEYNQTHLAAAGLNGKSGSDGYVISVDGDYITFIIHGYFVKVKTNDYAGFSTNDNLYAGIRLVNKAILPNGPVTQVLANVETGEPSELDKDSCFKGIVFYTGTEDDAEPENITNSAQLKINGVNGAINYIVVDNQRLDINTATVNANGITVGLTDDLGITITCSEVDVANHVSNALKIGPQSYDGSVEIAVTREDLGAASEDHEHGNIKNNGTLEATGTVAALVGLNNAGEFIKGATISSGDQATEFLNANGKFRAIKASDLTSGTTPTVGQVLKAGSDDSFSWTTLNTDNQKVTANGTGFGANDTINLVGGAGISVSADTPNKSITISNVAATSTTLGGIIAGGNPQVEPAAGNIIIELNADETGNAYIELPHATTNTIGGIKVSEATATSVPKDATEVKATTSGQAYVEVAPYELPKASSATLGGIYTNKDIESITVAHSIVKTDKNTAAYVELPVATEEILGCVKVQGVQSTDTTRSKGKWDYPVYKDANDSSDEIYAAVDLASSSTPGVILANATPSAGSTTLPYSVVKTDEKGAAYVEVAPAEADNLIKQETDEDGNVSTKIYVKRAHVSSPSYYPIINIQSSFDSGNPTEIDSLVTIKCKDFGNISNTPVLTTWGDIISKTYYNDHEQETRGGDITAENNMYAKAFYASSDKRLKENIEPFKNEKSILDLPIYKYDYIDGAKNQVGCLAQDLQEICPEMVTENNDGYLTIQESKLVYLLLDEVKKLKQEIEELKNK